MTFTSLFHVFFPLVFCQQDIYLVIGVNCVNIQEGLYKYHFIIQFWNQHEISCKEYPLSMMILLSFLSLSVMEDMSIYPTEVIFPFQMFIFKLIILHPLVLKPNRKPSLDIYNLIYYQLLKNRKLNIRLIIHHDLLNVCYRLFVCNPRNICLVLVYFIFYFIKVREDILPISTYVYE